MDGWPVSRSFAGLLNNVLVQLSRLSATASDTDNASPEPDALPSSSFYALLREWQGFIFPYRRGGGAGVASSSGGAEGGAADLSSQVLQVAR